jgi:proton-dependent oligopeptide transporter, POT family
MSEKSAAGTPIEKPPSPLKEIVQPFVDVVRAPRALWGINLPYFLEGMCYFGILGYLAIYFSETVFKGIPHADVWSHNMVGIQTAGITIAMFFLGFVADRYGVRRALIWAFLVMMVGRALIAIGPFIGLQPGLWGSLHLATLAGIFFVVVGYGMYQPAAYSAVKQFTNEKSAAMGYAMLYALMNLGGYIPTYAFLVRDKEYLGWDIPGVFALYAGFTFVSLMATLIILTKKTEKDAIAKAKAERGTTPEKAEEAKAKAPFSVMGWIKTHPLTDPKFAFFIFALIPVQTLFTYNWFIIPQYVERCFRSLPPFDFLGLSIPQGWIGKYFEIASNFNPLLVFIAVPIITALTYKRKVYNMMIAGTFIMAAPAFLLVLGTNGPLLFTFLLIMTVGEAMWQPRFLQYAAEIAPEGRTGEYMGVAQLPWFLTKVLVPLIYSGRMMEYFCPAEGGPEAASKMFLFPPADGRDPRTMWLIFGCIAMCSSLFLILAKRWVGKDFKTKS